MNPTRPKFLCLVPLRTHCAEHSTAFMTLGLKFLNFWLLRFGKYTAFFSVVKHYDPEDWEGIFLQNVSIHIQDFTVSVQSTFMC
jgi:hypothetical protein